MDKKPLSSKWLAIGIILLFVGIVFSPAINAQNITIFPKTVFNPKQDESVMVLEFKSDGTIEKSVVKMPREQVIKFREELIGVNDLDIRLSIYKKYNLIPQDVTAEKLRLGMEERAQRIRPEIEMFNNYILGMENRNSKLSPGSSLTNYCCSVYGWNVYDLRFFGGLSSLTGIINGIIGFFYDGLGILIFPLIPSADLFQIHFSKQGSLTTTNGDLPNSSIGGIRCKFFLFGFVGYTFSYLPLIFYNGETDYIGFAITCYGYSEKYPYM